MHVLFVFDAAPIGPPKAQFVATLQVLTKAGHSTSMVLGGDDAQGMVHLLDGGIQYVSLGPDMLASAALSASDSVAEFFTRANADVLYLGFGISLLIGSLAAVSLRRPYVVAVHEGMDSPTIDRPALRILLEQCVGGAQRVLCPSTAVAREVLATDPGAECRALPTKPTRGPSLDEFINDLTSLATCSALPERMTTVRHTLEQVPDVSISNPRTVGALVRVAQNEVASARKQLAQAESARDYYSAQLEVIRARQLQRIQRAERQTEYAQRDLDNARAEIDKLSSQLSERDHRLTVASIEAAELQRQVADIKSSTGWALLLVLWRIRTVVVPPGGLRDRTLWVILRTLRASRAQGISGLTKGALRGAFRTRLSGRLITLLPRGPAAWLNKQLRPPGSPASRIQASANGTRLLQSWSENTVLTVTARPNAATYDVIVFPIIDWNFRFQRPQQLASRFAAAGHRVFYIATTFCDGPIPVFRPIRQGVVEVQLPGPSGHSPYSDDLDAIAPQLTETLAAIRAQFTIADAICFANLPYWTPLVLGLRKRFGWKIVYDCLDDYSGFSNTTRRMLRREEVLARNSDLVLVTSRYLLDKQSALNNSCVLVPNAADFSHFRFGGTGTPAELSKLRTGHPVIGYYGAISDWFDSGLVRALARARPEWEFVLIGSTFGCDLRPVRDLPNVHLLGEKPYAEIPSYLDAFSVGIIPFKKMPLTEATNPVKLFEYATAGKPIVATDLAEIRHYREYVALATSESSWLAAVECALVGLPDADRLKLVDFGRSNSWDHRLAQVKSLVEPLFPLASIIIVTYNNLDYTRLCLESILHKTSYPNFEIIVVDNASTDGTAQFLGEFSREHQRVKVILNDENYGFAKGNNIGIAAAKGEYIVFLNNDTVVTYSWLSRLTYYLRDQAVGMVGPVTNWSGNESRIAVDYTAISDMDAFAGAYTRRNQEVTFDIRMLALFCAALRRTTVEEVGLLDERFGIGMFEDDDYAMRVRQRGYRIVCAADVFIHHWGRASFSRLDEDFYRNLFKENQLKFEEKWGIEWEAHKYRAPIRG